MPQANRWCDFPASDMQLEVSEQRSVDGYIAMDTMSCTKAGYLSIVFLTTD